MFKFWGFSKQRWVFGKIVFKLRKCAEISNFAVECDRNSKISQNVPKSIFIEKLDDVFQKKHEHFNIAKDSKFAVECDFSAIITISQNVHFFPKNWWIFEKKSNLKIGKSSKFALESDRNSKSFQNVQNLILEKKLDEFFQKKHQVLKIAKDSKNVEECDWKFRISQNVHFFSQKGDGFFEKNENFKNR